MNFFDHCSTRASALRLWANRSINITFKVSLFRKNCNIGQRSLDFLGWVFMENYFQPGEKSQYKHKAAVTVMSSLYQTVSWHSNISSESRRSCPLSMKNCLFWQFSAAGCFMKSILFGISAFATSSCMHVRGCGIGLQRLNQSKHIFCVIRLRNH